MIHFTIELLELLLQIKHAASASRGSPQGDTVALEKIIELIKQFEDRR